MFQPQLLGNIPEPCFMNKTSRFLSVSVPVLYLYTVHVGWGESLLEIHATRDLCLTAKYLLKEDQLIF